MNLSKIFDFPFSILKINEYLDTLLRVCINLGIVIVRVILNTVGRLPYLPKYTLDCFVVA